MEEKRLSERPYVGIEKNTIVCNDTTPVHLLFEHMQEYMKRMQQLVDALEKKVKNDS